MLLIEKLDNADTTMKFTREQQRNWVGLIDTEAFVCAYRDAALVLVETREKYLLFSLLHHHHNYFKIRLKKYLTGFWGFGVLGLL